jgi:hypothetical protein
VAFVELFGRLRSFGDSVWDPESVFVGLIRWRGQDSNLRSPFERQIYSLLVLTTHPPLQ